MPDLEAFENVKRSSMAQLLFKCARLLNEQAIARLRVKASQPKIRVIHTTLFPHIDFQGIRLTDLAGKLGVTKQAAGQLVSELEEMGTLERIPDPTDGRAKLIRYSAAGTEQLFAGLELLKEIEREMADSIGEEQMHHLHQALIALEKLLDPTASS